jgi:hypothetical protein
MVVAGTKSHHMGKYQPFSLVCCQEKLKRMRKFDPSQGPEGLGLTLIYSRSMKNKAKEEILSGVRVSVLQSIPYQTQPVTVQAG